MADQVAGLLSPWLRRQRIFAAKPYLSGCVLDVGCGSGALAQYIDVERYYGLDRDALSLKVARTRFPKYRFEMAWPNGRTFDTVAMLAVIEHVKDPLVFLRNAALYLNDGGRIVLTTPHPSARWIHDSGSMVGLFSHTASEEHEAFLKREDVENIARVLEFQVACSRRFQFGLNQLFVLRKLGGDECS